MKKPIPWIVRQAKRVIAEQALLKAVKAIEESKHTGGSASVSTTHLYQLAELLARHAAEQLRLSERS